MDVFSISQLQDISGIKTHTIRMWEKRYKALTPVRSEGNTRYYDNNQLKRLLNIVSLIDSGFKVATACQMTDAVLKEHIDQHLNQGPFIQVTDSLMVLQLISTAMDYDEEGFDKVLSHAIVRFGMRETYINLVYPAMIRMGLMWSIDTLSPSQEHFASNLFRQKLSTVIDGLPFNKNYKEKWILFLPEGEWHDIGLMFANYYLRQSGAKVIYLGANIPFESLQQTVQDIQPQCLLWFVISKNNKEDVLEIAGKYAAAFRQQKLFIACNGNKVSQRLHDLGIKVIQQIEEMDKVLVKRSNKNNKS